MNIPVVVMMVPAVRELRQRAREYLDGPQPATPRKGYLQDAAIIEAGLRSIQTPEKLLVQSVDLSGAARVRITIPVPLGTLVEATWLETRRSYMALSDINLSTFVSLLLALGALEILEARKGPVIDADGLNAGEGAAGDGKEHSGPIIVVPEPV